MKGEQSAAVREGASSGSGWGGAQVHRAGSQSHVQPAPLRHLPCLCDHLGVAPARARGLYGVSMSLDVDLFMAMFTSGHLGAQCGQQSLARRPQDPNVTPSTGRPSLPRQL